MKILLVVLLHVHGAETLGRQDESAIKSNIIPNQQLAEELHKSIMRQFEK